MFFKLNDYIFGFFSFSLSFPIVDEYGSSVMFCVKSLVMKERNNAVLYFYVIALNDSLSFIIVNGFADFIVVAGFAETTIAEGFDIPLKRVLLAIKFAYKPLFKIK
jgi:hypothetical protein